MSLSKADRARRFRAVQNRFSVSEFERTLAPRGNHNVDRLQFELDRLWNGNDLSKCHCVVKIKNAEGKHALELPEVISNGDMLAVVWTIRSNVTAVAGALEAQLEFYQEDKENEQQVVWQSNVMEFTVPDSLESLDEVVEQEPSLYEQWEARIEEAEQNAQTASVIVTSHNSDPAAHAQAFSNLSAEITQSISAHNEDAEAHEELWESMHDVLLNYAAPAVIRTFGPAKSGVISNAVPGARLRAVSALGETTLSAEPSPEAPAAFSSIETISGSIGGQALGPISTPLRAVPAASGWTARDSIDLLSGSLSRRIAIQTFTGNEAWTKYNVGSSDVSTSCFTYTLTDKAVGWGTSICSHFRNTRGTHPFTPSRMTHGIYCDHNQIRNIYVDWGEGPDVTAEAFKAWLAEQNAAGTPVTLYYVLETPATEPVQAQSFVLESGTAAVTATAELRIDYLMDTGAALEELTNAVLAMGGELNV